MKITTELFYIPRKGNYMVYAPLRGQFITLVDKKVVEILKNLKRYQKSKDKGILNVIEFFKKQGIIDGPKDKPPKIKIPKKIEPTWMTLFPTSDCNFRCKYCYSRAGETQHYMNWELTKASIDFLFNSLKKQKKKSTSIDFHGGGEPFLDKSWSIVVKAIRYIKKKSKEQKIKTRIGGVSNGSFSKEKRNFIIENFDSIQISIDGPKDIQNDQRPMIINEKPVSSFDIVMKNIRALEKAKFRFNVRATLSKEGLKRFREIIEFFKKNMNIKNLTFEPLSCWGRQKSTLIVPPNKKEFAKTFVNEMFYQLKDGFRLNYSNFDFKRTTPCWCGSFFVVTPDGYVTNCIEVSNKKDPRANLFFYGYYNRGKKKFIFDIKKFQNKLNRNINNLDYCKNCFAKYQCAGECMAKIKTMDPYDIKNSNRCSIVKTMMEEFLVKLLNQENKDLICELGGKSVDIPKM